MIQTLKSGTVIHYRGFPARLTADIEVESGTDLAAVDETNGDDLLRSVDATVKQAQDDLFTKDA